MAKIALSAFAVTLWFQSADAGSNPLSWTPWWHETSHEFVTVVKKNGALSKNPLWPGLAFTPWKLMGETYYLVKVIPDTDCYGQIEATTMDHIKYKIRVCVTNVIDGTDAVEIISRLGFDYDTQALRIQAENSIKEVLMTYTWLDVEKTRSNMLNEDIAKKISTELVEKYGEVGGKIKVLGVTIKEKECMSPTLVKELSRQAEHQAQTATEKLRMQSEQAKEATETAKVRAQEERAEIVRKAAAERDLAKVKAENERQDLINKQREKDAESQAVVTRSAADTELQIRRNNAELIERLPAYAQHERAMAYSNALADKAKFVLTDNLNSQMQGSLTQGNTLGWLFGGSNTVKAAS
jgi:regulator of protease activity HflC (stomatin/prohibitin superfamily)